MKGVIFYYSATGNTALACWNMARRLPVSFDLADVTKARKVNLESSDAVGFAAPTDFWGVPRAFEAFIESLPRQNGKPVFVFNTFGALSGKTLGILAKTVAAKGFNVLAGHSLRMPENYPPMIARGMGAAKAPSLKAMAGFDSFISELGGLLEAIRNGRPVKGKKVRVGFVYNLFPGQPRTTARKDMGEKYADASVCTECGTCKRDCPYEAIRLEPKPIFDMGKCYGCWRCYNRCPAKAIYTKKFRGGPFYPGPSEMLKGKLGV